MPSFDKAKALLFSVFPNLEKDMDFKITGKPSPNFNCIAWAAFKDNVFWTNLPKKERPKILDGVTYDWPFGVENDFTIETLVNIFSKLDYIKTDNGDFEEGFRKIALYGFGVEGTHAARQLTNGEDKGKWTSKLGQSFVITHGTPDSLNSKDYGTVIQFMKKSLR